MLPLCPELSSLEGTGIGVRAGDYSPPKLDLEKGSKRGGITKRHVALYIYHPYIVQSQLDFIL
jgi:hypothetical protein